MTQLEKIDRARLPACLRHRDVTLADALAELQREYHARDLTFPEWLKKGRMTDTESRYEREIFAAMVNDFRRQIAGQPSRTESHGFTWAQRRAALQRELAWRAGAYPEWIAKGRMLQAEADTRTARLSAVLANYEEGWDWHPDPADRRPLHEQWRPVQAAIAATQPDAQQRMVM
ncbi:hypothetical protein [Croceicoccus mobilis]|uniref:Uncharacterized protein n=1 Tax=Croceicoccus mobilis TaxID=1703339 RepID=A0A916Z4G2_9SPHN|nr:hypothetical protein [Croceicoccus mobilis]GGD74130.1 hypothetical protein GCM10010990_24720 [Croceicoccus mobilis]